MIRNFSLTAMCVMFLAACGQSDLVAQQLQAADGVIACNSDSDCAGNIDRTVCGFSGDNSTTLHCVDPLTKLCNNGQQDNGESDVDCGSVCRGAQPPNVCGIKNDRNQNCNEQADCNDITDTFQCINGTCQHAACSTTSDCPNGLVCSGGTCIGCTSTSQCLPSEVCQSGVCEPTSTAACSVNNPNGTCPISGQVCSNGTCVSSPPVGRSSTCGIPSTTQTATCYSPDGMTTNRETALAGQEYCCPTQFSGALLFPIGTAGTCTRGTHSTANPSTNFGFLNVGGQISNTSYGCQP